MIKLEGFIQVVTKMGSFFCKVAELHEDWVVMQGPVIVTLQMFNEEKTGPQRVWNKEKTTAKYMTKAAVISVDVLDPVTLDKASKEVYMTLTGIDLM